LMTNEVFGPLGSSYSAYARDIHTSGRILLKSAEDALAITALLTAPERKRAGETSSLRAVIDDACAFAAPDLAAQSIAVAIDVRGDAEIVGDHQATRQMLINLIAEASRHAAAGAVLRIETKSAGEAVHLSLSLLTEGEGAPSEEGFAIILARTFCELSGAELTSGASASGEWTSARCPGRSFLDSGLRHMKRQQRIAAVPAILVYFDLSSSGGGIRGLDICAWRLSRHSCRSLRSSGVSSPAVLATLL
nr:hypothetical protein [Hyphomicrobium sp.]